MRLNKSVAIGAVAAIATAMLPMLALPASAATVPPWEPDPTALGTLTFFNASGQVVTGGSDLTDLFEFAEASTADQFLGTKAELGFAQPVPNGTPPITGTFPASALSATSVFPNASAPPPLNTATNPVVSLGPADANLANFIASVTAQTAAGFANVFQVRLYTTGPGGVGSINNGGGYWDADVMVDPNAGTWQEIYPNQGATTATTTTTLTASPAGTATQNASVALTATVTASDTTHPAGTVQFLQDGFDVGAPVAVNSSGVASLTTASLLPSAPAGTQLTAAFVATDSSSYGPSMSAPVAYTVNPVAVVPSISGAHQAGQRETCSEGRLDFGVQASYTWLVSGKSIGTGASITVPGSAYKKALSCRAAVRDGSGPSSTATSKSVTISLGKALKDTRKPSLTGPHKVGKVERVKAGTWPRGTKFTYQWLLNGKVIKHATRSSLKLSKADKGKKISCRVTAHLAGFANGVATSSSVKVS